MACFGALPTGRYAKCVDKDTAFRHSYAVFSTKNAKYSGKETVNRHIAF